MSPKEFDALFNEEANILEFTTPEEETAYERRDSFLIHLIRSEVQKHFGPDGKRQPHVGDDWWPNHTRYLDATPVHCITAFFTALLALLTDDFIDYRIQVCVYGDIMDGKSYIGSMALYTDRMLIERKLYKLFQDINVV